MEQIHLIIHGKVQEVWYRASTEKKAQELGVTGWVKNLPDGTVEVLAQGERAQLEALKDWCYEGPPAAKVEKIDQKWGEPEEKFKEFSKDY